MSLIRSVRTSLVCQQYLSTPVVQRFNLVRFNSTATKSSPSKKEDSTSSASVSITSIGVPMSPYIPPKISTIPLSQPITLFRCLLKRIGLFGVNTLQISRGKKDATMNFTLWKNLAIENYVNVNKAFASKSLQIVKSDVSSYVLKALELRSKTLPSGTSLQWKLLKFNTIPKIINFTIVPNRDESILCLQITYKFDTKQRLHSVTKGELKTVDRDMVEYVVFNVDPFSNEVCLAGTVFESGIHDRLIPKDANPKAADIFECMNTCGDIYRTLPVKSLEAPKKGSK